MSKVIRIDIDDYKRLENLADEVHGFIKPNKLIKMLLDENEALKDALEEIDELNETK